MRPSQGAVRAQLSSGLAEMTRKYFVLLKISVTVKHLIKKASPALLNQLQNRRQDSGSRAENVREFSSGARIRLHDCFRNAGDSARE